MGVKHTKSTYTFNKEMKMKVLCECNSFKGCRQTTDLSIETLTSIRNIKDSVIIIDGCPNGPERTDTLVEQKLGYSIYVEKYE